MYACTAGGSESNKSGGSGGGNMSPDYTNHPLTTEGRERLRSRNCSTRSGLFPPVGTVDPDVSAARTANEGHGRVEVRTARSCDLLRSWLRAKGFVGAEQVIRVERVRIVKGEKTVSVEYCVSSLARHEATAFDFLTWIRAHWGIENGLHDVRDETLGEDRCRVRKGGSAQVLAALRNAALHLMHDAGESNRKAATERFQIHPEEAIDLIHTRQCET